MLCAFSRDVVTSYADDRTGEAGQGVLVFALTGEPVHLGQRAIAGPHDGVLATFSAVEVAADVGNTSADACQHILLNALTGAPVHLVEYVITDADNHMLRAVIPDVGA